MSWPKVNFKTILILIFLGIISFGIGHIISVLHNGYQLEAIFENSHTLTYKQPTKKEVYIMYVMDVSCQFCNNEETVEAVNELVKKAKSKATNYNIKFILISIDNPYSSTTLLTKFESVDEINFGNQWQNHFVSRYLLNEGYTELSVPQLLIFERSNIIQRHGDFKNVYGFKDEKQLFHLKGMKSIVNFDYRKLFPDSAITQPM